MPLVGQASCDLHILSFIAPVVTFHYAPGCGYDVVTAVCVCSYWFCLAVNKTVVRLGNLSCEVTGLNLCISVFTCWATVLQLLVLTSVNCCH